jgi:hypothetical protein
VGWQSTIGAGPGKAACNPPDDRMGRIRCTALTYPLLLNNGITHKGQFLELWAPDILSFPSAVANAQAQLKK